MGKNKSQNSAKADAKSHNGASKSHKKSALVVDEETVNPTLASLFSTSLGPVQPLPKSRYKPSDVAARRAVKDAENDEELSELSSDEVLETEEGGVALEASDDGTDGDDPSEMSEDAMEEDDVEPAPVQLDDIVDAKSEKPAKKRKRKESDDDLEDVYMQKLVVEEQKEEEKRRQEKRQKREDTNGDEANEGSDHDIPSDDDDTFIPPQHESLSTKPQTPDELDKAARTVFLANVSITAITSKSAKKTLLSHLSSFLPTLAPSTPPHKIESLRFRSTAFSTPLPKKAAFAKKELKGETTQSTNAYVVYSTPRAASAAAPALNGSLVLGRHLRADHVSHPSPIDHKRCIFVGNLGFVDDASALATDSQRKPKPASDVEEGLWTHLAKCGTIEYVRVPRDAKTRVGKGFAYVQFADQNGVEKALLLDGKAFPPMLPRPLRVARAKSAKRNPKLGQPAVSKSKGLYNPKLSDADKSALGRTGKLLGKAGAAAARSRIAAGGAGAGAGVVRTPESFVFEGHRATASQGKTGFKFKGSKKNKAGGGRPKTRRTERAAGWKKSGGKKKD